MDVCKAGPTACPPLRDYIVSNSHPRVSEALGHASRKRPLRRGNSWVEEHHAHEEALVMKVPDNRSSSSMSPQEVESLMESPGVKCLPAREQGVVRLKAKEYGNALHDTYFTISTSLQYCHPPAPVIRCHTLTCSVKFFDFSLKRAWLGYEHFKIQLGIDRDEGINLLYPPSLLTQFPDSALRHMAGDGFAVPAFVAFFLAVVASIRQSEIVAWQ